VLARNEAKSDRADADRLARFWLRGTFPQSYLATPEVRQIRERVRYRMTLAVTRAQIKNRVQALLHRLGILHPFSDLFGKQGRAFGGRGRRPTMPLLCYVCSCGNCQRALLFLKKGGIAAWRP
jgi:hypothetical protein